MDRTDHTRAPGATPPGLCGDGTISQRRLRRSEAGLVAAHLVRLDPECRRLRFGRAVRDEFLCAYAHQAAAPGTVIEGAFIAGTLRGVAELRPMGHDAAEAAVSVETPWRRRGIGRLLMKRIELRARNHGIRSVVLVCLPENVAMRRLAASLGGKVEITDGELTYTIPEPPPTVFSLAREALADASDHFSRVTHWDDPTSSAA